MVGNDAGYAYRTFDDPATLTSAQTDPIAFIDDLPDKVILDDIHRVPAVSRFEARR